jgi:AbrB family looped-hinge helix DNA binding protein
MLSVTVSPKFQVVIPLAVREQLGITAGRKMQVIALDDRIELVPIEDAAQLRGFLRGIDTTIVREADRP